jgi:hypothetical protein
MLELINTVNFCLSLKADLASKLPYLSSITLAELIGQAIQVDTASFFCCIPVVSREGLICVLLERIKRKAKTLRRR